MARTPLLNHVEDAIGRIAAQEGGVTRREIVKRGAVAGVGLTLFGRAMNRHFICYCGFDRFDAEPEPPRPG